MPAYIISYDLHRAGQDYPGLHDAIKAYGKWWHNLQSTWIVVTESSAKKIRDGLGQHLDSNDKLLVVRSNGEGAWKGFANSGSKWLKDNL